MFIFCDLMIVIHVKVIIVFNILIVIQIRFIVCGMRATVKAEVKQRLVHFIKKIVIVHKMVEKMKEKIGKKMDMLNISAEEQGKLRKCMMDNIKEGMEKTMEERQIGEEGPSMEKVKEKVGIVMQIKRIIKGLILLFLKCLSQIYFIICLVGMG